MLQFVPSQDLFESFNFYSLRGREGQDLFPSETSFCSFVWFGLLEFRERLGGSDSLLWKPHPRGPRDPPCYLVTEEEQQAGLKDERGH